MPDVARTAFELSDDLSVVETTPNKKPADWRVFYWGTN
jgi:hypothetical protein